MKKPIVLAALVVLAAGCDKSPEPSAAEPTTLTKAPEEAPKKAAASPAKDPNAPKDVVDVAVASSDHTTLVKALEAADYVDSLTNPGPFTVFAPTNAAFDKLPKGTLEGLLEPDKRADLKNVLKYHVAVSVYQASSFKDGQMLGMANGAKTTFHVKDGKVRVNDANIVASIPVSNGIIHVVDAVLLPPSS